MMEIGTGGREGGDREGEREREAGGEGGSLAKSGNQLVTNKNINKAVLRYWPVSDRIIMMKIQGKPFNIAIVQVYAPTSASTDDEIEEFYNLYSNLR